MSDDLLGFTTIVDENAEPDTVTVVGRKELDYAARIAELEAELADAHNRIVEAERHIIDVDNILEMASNIAKQPHTTMTGVQQALATALSITRRERYVMGQRDKENAE